MNPMYPALRPLFFIFLFFTLAGACVLLFARGWGIGPEVILAANVIFFGVSLIVFRMQFRAMNNKNPAVFIRTVMIGMMIKMMVVAGAVVCYVLLSGKLFNRPAVYISMILYVVYLTVEVAAVMKLNRRKNA